MRMAGAFLCALWLLPALRAAQTLDVYVLDVEGGKSILLVSPSGQSMLFDAGWPGYNGRDVNRILEATRAAGVTRIDYLVISHYDIDHLGDVPLLASKIPIGHFVDHGPLRTTRADFAPRYDPYAAMRDKGQYMAVKSGDRIPIGGVDVTVITAATKVLDKPLPGAGAAIRFACRRPKSRSAPPISKIICRWDCCLLWLSSAC